MKIILEVEIPPAVMECEKITHEDVVAASKEITTGLREECPDGTTFTVRVEP